METFGDVSIDTFLNDINHIRPSTKLSQIFGEEKSQEFDEIYAYGYRFDLKTSIEFNAVRIKAKLADCNVTILILDHNDILREKKLFISSNNTTTMDWITISMKCQIEHNYCLLLWTKSNEKHIPMIAYKDSDHNLRQINEQISIRSKRAEINPSKDLNLNSKINVLYDALYTTDDQSEKAIPALEMILYI
ncbi:hypothetical protein I4U23_004752 [Adineta vaga]|nr:hypothetical protein I4U23_004752 [Adineta vaga]